jgi:hypothetical protein
LIAEKYRTQMEGELKKDAEKAKDNIEFMCKHQEEYLDGCMAATPKAVEAETHIVYTKPDVTVTARLVKERGEWKVLKVSVADKTPPK